MPFFQLVVLGTSLGGLHALGVVLSGLPQSFSLPIVVVHHRHKDSDDTLVFFLQQYSALLLKEAEEKEMIVPGQVYFAPADYHLLVEADGNLALSTEAPVSYARPSIDVLFESAADAYAEKVIGVILTGANYDGAQGLAKIKARGGLAIVQEPTTAESHTMPAAAVAAVAVDYVLPLEEISRFLIAVCNPTMG
ncbi:MAG: chemotaxis protein CheB [Chroococcidiopsidaceae cyanobacterium CP_BM_RX_35]|nr:chemotaxis protein CheB [Chroococcidiopsidaceae cyanobacterium CP_BM_RX_35]